MKKRIFNNIVYSFIEKFASMGSQFILSILLIRLLDREDYGIIGVVIGYFVFVNFLNISIESIILRDHKQMSKNIEKYFMNFFVFNIIKIILILIVSFVIGAALVQIYENIDFIYAIISATSILIADTIVAPLLTYSTAKFNQKIVTKFTSLRLVINLILSLGLFVYPTLAFVALKDFLVSGIYIFIWLLYFKRKVNLQLIFRKANLDFKFIKSIIFEYSLWTHLTGVVTTFIYKSDVFFLSFFVSLQIIGDYNIALTAANVATIIPMIIGYQNSIAISHTENDSSANRVSNTFIRISLLIGLITLLVFIFFGKVYLGIMTGQANNDLIYSYMIPIVIGLIIVKTIASPLVAYINIKSSVKGLFLHVLLPTFILTGITYLVAAILGGALAVARSNILISIVWLVLLVKYIRITDYSFSGILISKKDVKYLLKKIKR
jgi:O-antigen/teichoic acid export membrane protein